MIDKNGLNLIKEFEGFEAEAYIDPVGIPTIGYGTTKLEGKPVKMGMRISKEKAEQALKSDIGNFEKELNALVKVPLDQNQRDALLSFIYNIGGTKFKNSTLLKRLNEGEYKKASEEFGKWVYGNVKGKMVVLPGLVRRRQAEKKLFLTPELDETEIAISETPERDKPYSIFDKLINLLKR